MKAFFAVIFLYQSKGGIMSSILIPGSGAGGVSSSELTATAGDVLKGAKYVGQDTNDDIGTGTLELTGNATTGDVLANKTFYVNNPKSKQTGMLALSGNAAANRVLSPYTFYATDPKTKLTGTIPSYGGRTITPGTSNQTISAGNYLSGNVVIAGDGDLVAANIKNGKNIFNVQGTCKEYKYLSISNLASSSTSKRYSLINSSSSSVSLYYLTINPGFNVIGGMLGRYDSSAYFTDILIQIWSKVQVNSSSSHYEIPRSALTWGTSSVEIPVPSRSTYNGFLVGWI